MTGPTGPRLAQYAFRRPPELEGGERPIHPVAIVGAGLAGLTLAADLALRGVPAVVLDRDDSSGAAGIASRGIAYSKRTLEIFARLGVAERVREIAVTWNEGRIYHGTDEVHHFVLQPDPRQKWPGFLNLQQFFVEEVLVERIGQLPAVDLRWQSLVTAVEPAGDHVVLTVSTPDGEYQTAARWVAACDGAASSVRRSLGIRPPASRFEDHWAIVDVRADLGEVQRELWLDSPLLEGGVLIKHGMADGVVRTDWQISQFPDPDSETTPERVRERLAAVLGDDVEFEVVSVSRWQFKRRVMDRLVHGRVLFLGDAAHEIPPFGARGGNGGIQDAENLAWKLAAVLDGSATPVLLESFDRERAQAAVENADFACRSASFITPTTDGQRLFREAVLRLARRHAFARTLIDTGRPSTATAYRDSPLSVADREPMAGIAPGAAAADGPVRRADGSGGHLLDCWRGRFTALWFADGPPPAWPAAPTSEACGMPLDHLVVCREDGPGPDGATIVVDPTGDLFAAYDAAGGACYLLRPDVHVAGRRRGLDPGTPAALLETALRQADPQRAAAPQGSGRA